MVMVIVIVYFNFNSHVNVANLNGNNVFQHDEDDSLPEYHDDSDDDGVPHIKGCLYGGPNKSFRMEVMDDD